MTAQGRPGRASLPRKLYRAIERGRRRMTRASAILRCLALVSRDAPDQEVHPAEIVDVVRQLTEKAIDRLNEVELLNAINGHALARDGSDVSPFASFGGAYPPATLPDTLDRALSEIAYPLTWLDQHGVLHEDDQEAFPAAQAAEQASTQGNSERRDSGDPLLTLVVGRVALIPRQRRSRPESVTSTAPDCSRDGPDPKPAT